VYTAQVAGRGARESRDRRRRRRRSRFVCAPTSGGGGPFVLIKIRPVIYDRFADTRNLQPLRRITVRAF